jgi:hypothetical protein
MSWTYRIHGSRRLSEKRSSAACSMALDRELSQVRDRVDRQRADDADRLERMETDIRAMRDLMFEAFQRGRTD